MPITHVLHLPTTVAGMPWALAEGERSLGLESRVLCISRNGFGYPCDVCLDLESVQSNALRIKKLISTFWSIRKDFDIFHFNFGRSLIHSKKLNLPHVELPFYPKKAKLFVTYNGCDARQKYPTMERTSISACQNPMCYGGVCNSGKRDIARQNAIKRMAKYANHMWSVNPDLLYFLPKEKSSFLPYAVIMDENDGGRRSLEAKRLKIVHAPTNRVAKGSELIIAAVKELERTHGDRFEFQLVENMPHSKTMEIFRGADLVVDQILIGWYGAVAVEVMRMGKPVICRIATEDLKFIPKQMAKDVVEAFIHTEPNTFKETLLRCLEDRDFLRRKGEAGLDYAHRWHDLKYVAGLTKEVYDS